MPRERIPQHELVWLEAKLQKRNPYNGCCRFGKTVRTFFRFARAPRLNAGEEIVGVHRDLITSSEQNSLRSHWDSAEVTASITDRFADQCELCFCKTSLQIRA